MGRRSYSGGLVLGTLSLVLAACETSPPIRDDETYQNWRAKVITTDSVAIVTTQGPVTFGQLANHLYNELSPRLASLEQQLSGLEGLRGVVEGRQAFQAQYDQVTEQWRALQEEVRGSLRAMQVIEGNYTTNTELAGQTLAQYQELIGAPIDQLGGGVRALNERHSRELELTVDIYRVTQGFLAYHREQQEVLQQSRSQATALYRQTMESDIPLERKLAAWDTAMQAREAAQQETHRRLVARVSADTQQLRGLFDELLNLSHEAATDRDALRHVTTPESPAPQGGQQR